MKLISYSKYTIFFPILLLAFLIGCSYPGLISEKYSSDKFRVPKLLHEEPHSNNPTFILYGDVRPGYRLYDKFLDKKNWITPKIFLIPFYELYVCSNGILGVYDIFRNDSEYGISDRKMVRNAIYREARHLQADFILNTGDLVIDGRHPDHWWRFITEHKIEQPLLDEIPYIPVIGSHECSNDSTFGLNNFNAVFNYPRFFTLEFPDVELFLIDSNIIIENKQLIDDDTQDALFERWIVSQDESNISWLENKLASSSKTFKIVVMHHPPVSFSTHHDDWMKAEYGNNLSEKRMRLIKLLQKYGVQIVLCGHEHLYEHSVLRYQDNEKTSVKNMHIIVSGGGGVPLRNKTDTKKIQKYLNYYKNEGLDVILVEYEKMYHYCRVSIDSKQVRIDVHEVTSTTEIPIIRKEEIVITAP